MTAAVTAEQSAGRDAGQDAGPETGQGAGLDAGPDTAEGTPAPLARLRWRSAMTGAFVATLVRPASWALGLAGFLAGGGLVIVSWPILVLPTPTGLQNALGTPVSSLVFGSPSAGLVALIMVGAAVSVAVLAGALVAGAWAERQGIEMTLAAADDEGLIAALPDLRGAPGTSRVALVRLFSLVPVAVVMALAWQPLYDVTYHELILPEDLVTPLPIRVIRSVPWLLAGIAATWLVSDTAAAEGVRRLVLERRSVPAAWALGWVDLVHRPLRVLGAALAGIVVLVLLAGPSLILAAVGWQRVRDLVGLGQPPALVLVAVMVWVSIWLGGLVLTAVGAAFRTAAMTMEAVRRS
ncbi:MAG TPA: hypothetical protein VIK13_04010 [Candidatus Limnocylindrales bacterium]